MPITAREKSEVDAANLSGKEPVAFIHGLWLLPNSWDAWRGYFEDLGFATLAPGWPDDPASIEEALANPDVFANKSINEICQHLADVVKGLTRKPIIVGHSFGGLLTEKLAGLGFATASIAISPAPFRGVLPLPVSALKAAFPVLKSPANKSKAIRLTYEQFRFAFANEVSEDEAKALYDKYSVPGTGKDLVPGRVRQHQSGDGGDGREGPPGPRPDADHLRREGQHRAVVDRQRVPTRSRRRTPDPTEIVKIAGRGHSLTIDSGWREVADAAAAFLARHDLKP